MNIKKYYKNNGEVKKEILTNTSYLSDRELRVHCYTSADKDLIATDLEVDVYTLTNDYVKSYTVASIETIEENDNFNEIMDLHRERLSVEKKKLFSYLKKHFHNVKLSEDYSQ